MSRTRQDHTVEEKTIDLSTVRQQFSPNSNIGPCEGCGLANSSKRFVTREFLCPACRDDLQYKLITKSTVARLYPLLNMDDVMDAAKAQRIHCFKTVNWHNRKSAPIKLFYEKEIMAMMQHQEKHTKSAAAHQRRSHSRHHDEPSSTSSTSSSRYPPANKFPSPAVDSSSSSSRYASTKGSNVSSASTKGSYVSSSVRRRSRSPMSTTPRLHIEKI